ncbi:MAG: hypothetical protein AAF961_03930, partial [Planctomycetota bacterium]
ALHNSGKTENSGSRSTSLQFGVRVDCLWELLKHHGLWDHVDMHVDPETIDVDRFTRPDPEAEKLSQVRRLLARARIDLNRKQYDAAIEKCNDAEKLLPEYAEIFDVRANAYNFIAVYRLKGRGDEAKKYYRLGLEDARTKRTLSADADAHLDEAMSLLNYSNADRTSGYAEIPEAVRLAGQILSIDGIRPRDRAYAFRLRAFASGLHRSALEDLQRSVAADPWLPQGYWSLKIFWGRHGNRTAANQALAMYERVSAAEANADQAWLAATSAEETQRNGHHARELAIQACEASDYKWWKPLRSLAAAYAEMGNFERAVEYGKKAAAVAPPEELDAINRQLLSYVQKKPFRAI